MKMLRVQHINTGSMIGSGDQQMEDTVERCNKTKNKQRWKMNKAAVVDWIIRASIVGTVSSIGMVSFVL